MGDTRTFKPESNGGAVDESISARCLVILADAGLDEATIETVAIELGRTRMLVNARDETNSPATVRNHLSRTADKAADLRKSIAQMPEDFRAIASNYLYKTGREPTSFHDLERRLQADLNTYAALSRKVAQDTNVWTRAVNNRSLEHSLLGKVADLLKDEGGLKTLEAAGVAADALRATGISVPGGSTDIESKKLARKAIRKFRG